MHSATMLSCHSQLKGIKLCRMFFFKRKLSELRGGGCSGGFRYEVFYLSSFHGSNPAALEVEKVINYVSVVVQFIYNNDSPLFSRKLAALKRYNSQKSAHQIQFKPPANLELSSKFYYGTLSTYLI